MIGDYTWLTASGYAAQDWNARGLAFHPVWSYEQGSIRQNPSPPVNDIPLLLGAHITSETDPQEYPQAPDSLDLPQISVFDWVMASGTS